MTVFSRTDKSVLSQWWWTVDKLTLGLLLAIVVTGIVLNIAASPSVAERIGLPTYYFVQRHLVILPIALGLMISISMVPVREIQSLSFALFILSIFLILLTLFIGSEIKGATRWISLGGFSLQPSELVKPTFAVITAWCFARKLEKPGFPGNIVAISTLAVVLILLLLQPDLGMTLVIAAVFGAQFFLAGLPLMFVLVLLGLGVCTIMGAYMFLPHVQKRIDMFLDPNTAANYQVTKSINAFREGGLFGAGPGEGTVKSVIPDVHADFIFAVAGEEFGFFACLFIVVLFAMVVISGYLRLMRINNMFILLAVAGILTQFGIQALINMASTLNMMPTKGMTLPFISYGGSSLLALAVGMGIVLGLTRKRPGMD